MSKYAKLTSVGKPTLTTKDQDEKDAFNKLRDDNELDITNNNVVLMPTVLLRTNEQKNNIINNNSICIIDVHADWCEPCKLIEKDYAELASKYNQPGVCILVSENIDSKLEPFRGTPDITGVPTFLIYINGVCQTQHTIIGADINKVETLVKQLRGFE
jgi:thioredoxin 1